MGETTREIEEHINRTREDLASNIRELDNKVRSAADWKEHFNNHPGVALGVAFGGGLVLGSLVMGRSNGMTSAMSASGQMDGDKPVMAQPKRRSVHQERALQTWDLMKGALLGIAATRLTEMVDEFVPGFLDQFHRLETEGRNS